MDRGWWPVAALILISSLLAVVYIWRVVEIAYLHSAPENAAPIEEAPTSMLIPTWVLIGGSIYFGVNTELTINVAQQAAMLLLGVTP